MKSTKHVATYTYRTAPFLIGYLFIVVAWMLLRKSNIEMFAIHFLAGFLLVSGIQIVLWFLRIRLEIIGNNPIETPDD